MSRAAEGAWPALLGRLSVADRRLSLPAAFELLAPPSSASLAALRGSPVLAVSGFWQSGASLPPLSVLALASARAGPLAVLTFHPLPDSTVDGSSCCGAFASLHAEALSSHKSAVCAPLPGVARELHLVALPSSPPAWALYDVPPGSPAALHALLSPRRLPLVLDLDETLLQAVTLRSLDERAEAVARKCAAAQPGSPRRAALESDLARILADRALLREYAATDGATIGGARVEALPEGGPNPTTFIPAPPAAAGGSGEEAPLAAVAAAPRPVLRLPRGVVCTRVDPQRRDTSMLVRIRPGWDALRQARSALLWFFILLYFFCP